MIKYLQGLGGDLSRRDMNGYTPLHHAVMQGHDGVVEQLLRAGADPYTVTPDGMTVLHLAAWKGQKKVLGRLTALGLDLGLRSRHGSSVLHEATLGGHQDLVAWLLHQGADPAARDLYGYLPEDLAYTKHLWEIYTTLRNARAEKEAEPVDPAWSEASAPPAPGGPQGGDLSQDLSGLSITGAGAMRYEDYLTSQPQLPFHQQRPYNRRVEAQPVGGQPQPQQPQQPQQPTGPVAYPQVAEPEPVAGAQQIGGPYNPGGNGVPPPRPN